MRSATAGCAPGNLFGDLVAIGALGGQVGPHSPGRRVVDAEVDVESAARGCRRRAGARSRSADWRSTSPAHRRRRTSCACLRKTTSLRRRSHSAAAPSQVAATVSVCPFGPDRSTIRSTTRPAANRARTPRTTGRARICPLPGCPISTVHARRENYCLPAVALEGRARLATAGEIDDHALLDSGTGLELFDGSLHEAGREGVANPSERDKPRHRHDRVELELELGSIVILESPGGIE